MKITRTFNRFELKYLIPIDVIPLLEEVISKNMIPDKYGDEAGRYALSSLYYDTPSYHFYWEKIEWLRFRRKVRIRSYETIDKLKDDDNVFVEIKQRIDRVTQKRRVMMKYKTAIDFLDNGVFPISDSPQDQLVINEIEEMRQVYKFNPSCVTSYFRQAWHWSDLESGLRITFDTNIRERTKDLDLSSKKIGKYMVSPDMSIMEVKCDEAVPLWITEMVSKYNLRLIRVSKYCQGLETAELVSNTSCLVV